MKKLLLILSIWTLAITGLFAQTVGDALRFGYYEVGGTARTVGVGGSLSALGTDFAAIGINPAGLALYRKSEVMITPSLLITNTGSLDFKASSYFLFIDLGSTSL